MPQALSRSLPLLAASLAALVPAPALAAEAAASDAVSAPQAEIVLTVPAATTAAAVPTATAAAVIAAAADDGVGEWTPLGSDPFGKELFAKWVPVPNGSSGAPRQGWLGTADGFFTREVHLAYTYTDAVGSDADQGLARFHLPLSRRLWAGIEVPFYQERVSRSGFGDITLNTQVMLVERRNVSLNAGVGWRLPTGAARLGNGVFAAQPQINLFTDIGGGFSFRGRISNDFPDSNQPESFILNGAIGQTFTDHDKAPIGDFTWYVATTWRAFANGPDFLAVTPGVRTHLGSNLFLLAGIEIPLSDARRSFREGFTDQLVQGF
jgi:hypothetical protein